MYKKNLNQNTKFFLKNNYLCISAYIIDTDV
jgi:hypothetical protein